MASRQMKKCSASQKISDGESAEKNKLWYTLGEKGNQYNHEEK